MEGGREEWREGKRGGGEVCEERAGERQWREGRREDTRLCTLADMSTITHMFTSMTISLSSTQRSTCILSSHNAISIIRHLLSEEHMNMCIPVVPQFPV